MDDFVEGGKVVVGVGLAAFYLCLLLGAAVVIFQAILGAV